ncbi:MULTISPECIES: hypothetical protein [Nostoc]|uniref:Serine/threonine protein kinase n=1 Tax=Nostoc paludosum FACHB-159 TaxID=2692908 RepID=A0ABR8KGB7_9NOSO|nr:MULTISPECIES: hypothetical protein [Nostoc]MBD2681639.1 hypothetical protein [Nostoc sp. FACHB-857]MBD2738100.1 hypothetical protein [Nostoc paludosum FACHB-159]
MKKLVQLTDFGSVLCLLIMAGTLPTTAQAKPQSTPGPISAPNVTLNVQRSSGICPQTIGLWWFTLPYEGGAEHTVVADTREFADSTKLVSSNNQFAEFVSPLRSDYASCVGKTRTQEYTFYNVEFKNKKAYFRVDLRKINAPGRLITYKTVAASRPYVRWAIAD